MMFPLFSDPTFLLLIPALLLAMWAQWKVKSTYAKYAQVGNRQGLTGAEVAQLILRDANVGVAGGGSGRADAVGLEPIGRDFIFPVDWTCGCGAGFSMQASREEREIAPALESIKMWRTWTAIGKHSLG